MIGKVDRIKMYRPPLPPIRSPPDHAAYLPACLACFSPDRPITTIRNKYHAQPSAGVASPDRTSNSTRAVITYMSAFHASASTTGLSGQPESSSHLTIERQEVGVARPTIDGHLTVTSTSPRPPAAGTHDQVRRERCVCVDGHNVALLPVYAQFRFGRPGLTM